MGKGVSIDIEWGEEALLDLVAGATAIAALYRKNDPKAYDALISVLSNAGMPESAAMRLSLSIALIASSQPDSLKLKALTSLLGYFTGGDQPEAAESLKGQKPVMDSALKSNPIFMKAAALMGMDLEDLQGPGQNAGAGSMQVEYSGKQHT